MACEAATRTAGHRVSAIPGQRHHPITRRSAVLGLAAGAASATLGCSRRRDDVVRFWAIGREGEVSGELARDFMQKNPGITVEVQKMPLTAAHEKLLTAYAGDTLPDVCQLGNTWLAEFVALDCVEPLASFITRAKFPTDDYFPAILDSNRIDGELFGIPWYVDTRLLFYRTDMLRDAGFAAPPNTWDEWKEMLAAIKQKVGPQRYSVLLPINEYDQIMIFGLQQPAEMLRDNGRYGNFRSADFKRALEFYSSMFEREWAPRMTNTQISNVWDEFGNGYYAFYMSGPWNIEEFKQRLPARLQDSWMTAPVPGPDGPGFSSAGGSSLVIFRSSQLKEQAWKFIEYLSAVETQRRFYQLTGDIPPRVTTWEAPELTESKFARAFRMQLDRVRSPPRVPEWERICQEMRMAAERVVQGTSSVEQAQVALDRKADEILEKRRWMMDKANT
jgi:multiple sugar transport system substrate-binding protein